MEHKLLTIDGTEVKFDPENGRKFQGYASVFNGLDSYGDTIIPGAYSRTLENRRRPVRMRWNHFGPVIGKWLTLQEDDRGLYVEGELTPGHSIASDVAASLMHKAIDGLSIGYMVNEEEMDGDVRVLKEIELVEISVVEEPADINATISNIKSAIDDAKTIKELEGLLRDAGGFSRAHATALVGRIKALSHGEREEKANTRDLLNLIHNRLGD